MQAPSGEEHCKHPDEQAVHVGVNQQEQGTSCRECSPTHSPSASWKKPGAQVAHSVPFEAVVHPGEHVHDFDPLQTPLRQLQAATGDISNTKKL